MPLIQHSLNVTEYRDEVSIFNYVVLRITLENDAKHLVHRHSSLLQYRLHRQLAIDLQIRHIPLSSFVIDTTDQHEKGVHVTFTLLDNPSASSSFLPEPSSLELI